MLSLEKNLLSLQRPACLTTSGGDFACAIAHASGGALTFALFVRHDLRVSAAHSANGTRGPVRSMYVYTSGGRAIDALVSTRARHVNDRNRSARRYTSIVIAILGVISLSLLRNVISYVGRANNATSIGSRMCHFTFCLNYSYFYERRERCLMIFVRKYLLIITPVP